MADNVLNRLLNGIIPTSLVVKWLLHDASEVNIVFKAFVCVHLTSLYCSWMKRLMILTALEEILYRIFLTPSTKRQLGMFLHKPGE